MNELRRMAYLQAMGIDSYVSRGQLPGAAPTRRLAIVPVSHPETGGGATGTPDMPKLSVPSSKSRARLRPRPQPNPNPNPAAQGAAEVAATRDRMPQGDIVPRFSLAAIVAGNWLWLEDLAGMPLATDQLRLVQAMSRAIRFCAEPGAAGQLADDRPPELAQFDWPIHNNRQLDLGIEAARAGVAGFIGRKLQQYQCRGVVLLGQSCEKWVSCGQLGVPAVSTASSAQILTDPTLKRQVWRDLLPLVSAS